MFAQLSIAFQAYINLHILMIYKFPLALFIALFILTTSTLNATPRWGQTGHRVVGEIAEEHLTKKTKKKLAELLNHRSLAFSSTFADEIKADDRYDSFSTWHYVNMPFDVTYEQSTKNPMGNLVTGIEYCKIIIQDDTSSIEDKAFYLKFLIHLIGDLHQPMHIGQEEDRGGNNIKLQWFKKDTNLHSVWDSKMIDDYGMSYTELADDMPYLSKNDIKDIQKGTVIEWVNETQQITKKVYASAKNGDNLRYEYTYAYFDTVMAQLQKGGLRLAEVLNGLF